MSHISESQFHALCFGWMEKQQRLTRPRGWQLKEYYRGEKRAFYLSLCNCTVSRPISDDPPLDLGREDDLIEEEGEANLFVDPQELQVNVEGISYTYEYHIAYSPIFSVPVLYFQAYDRDGKMLGFEDHWSLIPKMHQDDANRRIMISQGVKFHSFQSPTDLPCFEIVNKMRVTQ
eukprot:TRINITY_DN4952_c0_g1_i2.p1 TRINITY_DN4952_c0_g1~~TRINITY_DN4952_c0_g1_i2.p1  ORF type:complete len:175 (+),score=31.51 TRINITY_DN4952_c0_g1_i2:76-600(+)